MKSNSVVFNSFLSLLMGNLSKDKIYNDRNFDIWLCSKGRSFSGINYPNYTLSSYYTEDNITYLFNLGSLKTETVYSEDGLPSSGCYQMAENGFLNIPASAYIFSKIQYPIGCRINKDYNYEGYDYSVADINNVPYVPGVLQLNKSNNYDITKISAYNLNIMKIWPEIDEYFASEYNFSSGYNEDEYATYNVKQDQLIEDQTNVIAENTKFDIQPTNVIGGALMITWTNGPRVTLYNNNGELTTVSATTALKSDGREVHKPFPVAYKNMPSVTGSCIPVCYMELPKTYNLKDVAMNIQWSEQGLFSLK